MTTIQRTIPVTGNATYPGPTNITGTSGSFRARPYSAVVGTEPVLGDDSTDTYVDLTSLGTTSYSWVTASIAAPAVPVTMDGLLLFEVCFTVAVVAGSMAGDGYLYNGSLTTVPRSATFFSGGSVLGTVGAPETVAIFADVAADPSRWATRLPPFLAMINAGVAWMGYSVGVGSAGTARVYEMFLRLTYQGPRTHTPAPPAQLSGRADGLGPLGGSTRLDTAAPSRQSGFHPGGYY